MGKQKWKCLSGSSLKIIAMVTMLIDHVAATFGSDFSFMTTPLFELWGVSPTPYGLCRMIGRTAFPLYVFLLVEGFVHTRDRKKYGVNLLLFALLSELPWNLVHGGTWLYGSQNVFFTLFLGYACLCLVEYLKDRPLFMLAGVMAFLSLAWFLRADYGFMGVGVILCFYFLRSYPLLRCGIGLPLFSAGWRTLPALGLMCLYNGQRGCIRGRVGKYICYAFYPVHLLILWFLKYHVI